MSMRELDPQRPVRYRDVYAEPARPRDDPKTIVDSFSEMMRERMLQDTMSLGLAREQLVGGAMSDITKETSRRLSDIAKEFEKNKWTLGFDPAYEPVIEPHRPLGRLRARLMSPPVYPDTESEHERMKRFFATSAVEEHERAQRKRRDCDPDAHLSTYERRRREEDSALTSPALREVDPEITRDGVVGRRASEIIATLVDGEPYVTSSLYRPEVSVARGRLRERGVETVHSYDPKTYTYTITAEL